VTEYRLRQPQHKANYTIEIDCMTETEIEEQVEELLWSYRQFHLCDLDAKDFTADELRRFDEESKVAWDTLKAAFGTKAELTEEYLRDSSDGAAERIQAQLKEWTKQLHWPAELKHGGWLGTADTAKECNNEARQFLTGSLWPFVKVIRYVHL
jgi:hypothetical protein